MNNAIKDEVILRCPSCVRSTHAQARIKTDAFSLLVAVKIKSLQALRVKSRYVKML